MSIAAVIYSVYFYIVGESSFNAQVDTPVHTKKAPIPCGIRTFECQMVTQDGIAPHFVEYLVPRPLPDTVAYPFSTSIFRISTVLFFPKPAASEIAELGISLPLSSW